MGKSANKGPLTGKLSVQMDETPLDQAVSIAKRHCETALMANPQLTRRAFFGGAAVVGALAFLGSVRTSGGLIVNAYADESGSKSFSVYVLSREEVPIMAMEINADGTKTPVQGTTVAIRSLYNGQRVEVTTDSDGFAPANVRALSFECDDDNAATYNFYGLVEAAPPHSHYVCFPKELIQAGVPSGADGVRPNVIEIPVEYDPYYYSHRFVNAYLSAVALDDVDILHSPAPAYVSENNDADHEIYVEVKVRIPHIRTEVALFVDDAEIGRKTTTQTQYTDRMVYGQWCGTVRFTGDFLRTIKPGQKLKVWFQAEDDYAKSVTLPIEFKEPLILDGVGRESMTLTYGCDPDGNKETRESSPAFPWIFGKGDSFFTSIPGSPVQMFTDEAGNFGFVTTWGTVPLFKNVNGVTDPDWLTYKSYSGKVGSAGLKAWKNDVWKYCKERYEKSLESGTKHDGLGYGGFTAMIDAKLEFLLKAFGSLTKTPPSEEIVGTADLGICASASVQTCFGAQFSTGIIPFYLAADISFGVTFSLSMGMKIKNRGKKIEWNHTSSGGFAAQGAIVLFAQAGFTAAVGILGVISLGVRACIGGKLQIILDREDGLPLPRAIGSAEWGVQVIVQLIFFKRSFYVFGPKGWGPWKSWESNASLAQDDADAMLLTSDVELTADDMFTQAELGSVAEYAATPMVAVDSPEATLLVASNDLSSGAPFAYERIRPEREDVLGAEEPSFLNPYACLEEYKLSSTSADDRLVAADQAYNPCLGLQPSVQDKMLAGVFSNTRLRTFVGNTAFNDEPERNTIMARLVPATIPASEGAEGRQCTRVALRKWDAAALAFEEERIVDFIVDGVAAQERMDVDFHIDYVERNDNLYVAVAVTSVCLPVGMTCDYEEAENKQFVTLVMYNATTGATEWATSLRQSLDFGTATYQPRVQFQGKTGDIDKMRLCLYTMHKHFADMDNKSLTGVYLSSYNLEGKSFIDNAHVFDGTHSPADFVTPTLFAKGTYDVATNSTHSETAKHDTYTVVAWQGADGKGSEGLEVIFGLLYVLEDGVESAYKQGMGGIAGFSKRGDHMADNLFVFNGHTERPSEKKNSVVRFANGGSTMEVKETDSFSIDTSCFSSSNGRRLYTVRVNEGADPTLADEVREVVDTDRPLYSNCYYDEDTGANFGGFSTDATKREPIYQLLESRWIESLGAYHEFYPIARLQFAPDTASVLTCSGGERDFVMTNITDIDNAISDVYKVSVPDVIAVQLEGVSREIPYAAEGDKVPFVVALTNIGNCLVTGFTVIVTDSAGKEVLHKECPDLREYLMKSKDNYHAVTDDAGNPTYNEDGTMRSEFVEDIRDTSGVLWPGFSRNYQFNFTMPAGYQGSTEFNVTIADVRSNPYASTASAEEVLASVSEAQATLAATADGDAVLMAEADHLSWLPADEFAEALFGADTLRVEDPRSQSFSLEQPDTELMQGNFAALPATYVVEGETDGGLGADEDGGDGGSAGGDVGDGAGAAGSAAKAAPSTGDNMTGVAVLAGAAAAAGVAVAAKAHGAADGARSEGEE